jgi:Kef-type K+ transport system membrane component KefB
MFKLATFLAQVSVIIGATRLVGYLLKKLNQPQIIGDVTAGILLGPSLLGWLAPSVMAPLFPAGSIEYLNAVSQVGLLLYMFVVGLKLDVATLSQKKYTAILTSNGSIICPFFLGSLLAFYLYPKLTDGGVPLVTFVLFMGTAMSITAFPVLARILDERNLLRDKIGTVAIACAAVDDITAWLMLAAITVYTQAVNKQAMLWLTVPGLIIYFGLMWFVVRPGLLRLHDRNPVRATPGGMSLIFCSCSFPPG